MLFVEAATISVVGKNWSILIIGQSGQHVGMDGCPVAQLFKSEQATDSLTQDRLEYSVNIDRFNAKATHAKRL